MSLYSRYYCAFHFKIAAGVDQSNLLAVKRVDIAKMHNVLYHRLNAGLDHRSNHKEKKSKIQDLQNSKIRNPKSSKIQNLPKSKIQNPKSSKIQNLPKSKIQDLPRSKIFQDPKSKIQNLLKSKIQDSRFS